MKNTLRIAYIMIFIIWLCIVAYCLLFIKNPFKIQFLNLKNDVDIEFEQIADSQSTYIYLNHAELLYTGYYRTDVHNIREYCFLCQIGQQSVFVLLDANKLRKMTDNMTENITDISVFGEFIYDSKLLINMSKTADCSVEDYIKMNHISRMSIIQNGKDYWKWIIFYSLSVLCSILILFNCVSTKRYKEIV